MVMDLNTLVHTLREQRNLEDLQNVRVLALDPGHTTGWAMFLNNELIRAGQIDTTSVDMATQTVGALFKEFEPQIVVAEEYRVYKWRAKHHTGSDLLTARVIGCIETLCAFTGASIIKQPANVAKGFCTDTKLRDWGVYQTGYKHANDAVRHGCYFLCFGAIQRKDKTTNSHSVG